ncbi:MAG TPA: ABC transporter ATP-binding protein [Candidatus Dormibacteraeota bacterium]|nr:ABC transporter ATP-binding protein [Candidatus Dormibacteraeota bacterium]
MTAACECRDVSKWFDGLSVLDHVDLEVPEGAFVTIIGPSGCGKTTLLRAMAGLTGVDAGEIKIGGRTVMGPPEGVAMVFQGSGLMPWKTIYDNVAFGLVVAGRSRREIGQTVPRFIEKVNLTGYERLYPYQVSGGMRQRAGLARALAVDPSVLLMDEPFASVDAQTREVLHDELLTIWERERKSVVFVTHSIDEAIVLSDVVVVMSRRPARVTGLIEVDIPRPRRERTVRGHPRYADIRERCWELLEEARHGDQP